MTGKIKGNGGYPVGAGGKALVMLWYRISPVAWLHDDETWGRN